MTEAHTAYLNVKLPPGARKEEALSIARHEPGGWKCDNWRSEADRIIGMRRLLAARKSPNPTMTAYQRRGYVRVELLLT
jgi:hypothetical protein